MHNTTFNIRQIIRNFRFIFSFSTLLNCNWFPKNNVIFLFQENCVVFRTSCHTNGYILVVWQDNNILFHCIWTLVFWNVDISGGDLELSSQNNFLRPQCFLLQLQCLTIYTAFLKEINHFNWIFWWKTENSSWWM